LLRIAEECDPRRHVQPRGEDRDREPRGQHDVLAGPWVKQGRIVRAQWVGDRRRLRTGHHRQKRRECDNCECPDYLLFVHNSSLPMYGIRNGSWFYETKRPALPGLNCRSGWPNTLLYISPSVGTVCVP